MSLTKKTPCVRFLCAVLGHHRHRRVHQPSISHPHPPSKFLTLANELLLLIAENLPALKDLRALLQCNHRLYGLIRPVLLRNTSIGNPIRVSWPQYCSAFIWACRTGRTSLVADFLHIGGVGKEINVLAGQSHNRGPLHAAALEGRDEVVKLLLGVDSTDVNIHNGKGWQPIHSAALMGHTTIVRLLIDAGSKGDVVTREDYPRTPLRLAIAGGSFDIVAMLVEAGADTSRGDTCGITPAQFAVAIGASKEIIKVLGIAAKGEETIPAWCTEKVDEEMMDTHLMKIFERV